MNTEDLGGGELTPQRPFQVTQKLQNAFKMLLREGTGEKLSQVKMLWKQSDPQGCSEVKKAGPL